MESRTYYYARVSTKEQNLDRQLDAFRKLDADQRNIFTEKASGKDFNRPVYTTLRNQILRRGDTLVIKSLDRLSRNKAELKDEINRLSREYEASIEVINQTALKNWISETLRRHW